MLEDGVEIVEATWLDPRQDGREFDATDSLFITYKDGQRDTVATDEQDIWRQENSYQTTGTGKYAILRELGGRIDKAGAGDAPADVHGDHSRHDAGIGPEWRAAEDSVNGGASVNGFGTYGRHRADSSGLQERPARSRRHCPGCRGHELTGHSGLELFSRGIGAWALGWFLTRVAGFQVSLPQYVSVTGFALALLFLFRPVWRELINSDDNYKPNGKER